MSAKPHQDLLIVVDDLSEAPLYQQIYEQVRQAIITGALTRGDKLPSIRGLAKTLSISHITIEKAYLQLAVEGYVDSIPRSGFVVRPISVDYFKQQSPDNTAEIARIANDRRGSGLAAERSVGANLPYDFSYFNLQPASFPRRVWAKLAGETMLALPDDQLVGYPFDSDPSPLARELATYLGRTRGVRCQPEQVLVFPSSGGAVTALLPLFDRDVDVIGLEEPGWDIAYNIFRSRGFTVAPLRCWPGGSKSFLGDVEASGARLVFTTPSHQFPTGAVLPLGGRVKLLEWAHAAGAYIIEDDSCNEYRYETRAIPSLQSLDTHNRVIYLGNFSKVLSPGLRAAYLVLPPDLLEQYYATTVSQFTNVPVTLTDALARFIAGGHLDQHVRRMQTGNHARHDRLLECLTRAFGNLIELHGVDSGMHFFARVGNGMSQEELIASARDQGANVYETRCYWFENPSPDDTLMIGFSAIALDDIEPGVGALKRAWL